MSGHSLRGLCGLKFTVWDCLPSLSAKSQPARAVWIEILEYIPYRLIPDSHSLRGLCGLKYNNTKVHIITAYVTACEGCVD